MGRTRVLWSEEAMAACTSGASVCAVAGCLRSVYRAGLCSDHWVRPEPGTCGHAFLIITCGCCERYVCEACYGEWNALACFECRKKARGQAS